MTVRALAANWSALPPVVAGTTLRSGGADDLPAPPKLLQQVHGNRVVEYSDLTTDAAAEADAIIARQPGQICVVKTADCLPVLLSTDSGDVIAAVHAGWRGMAAGVIEATIEQMAVEPATLMAWLGPAISAQNFEVGDEVRQAFGDHHRHDLAFFEPNARGRWQADLYELARARLMRSGVWRVSGGGWCTFADPARFYSYRRDGGTGRLLSFIYRKP
ncbi:MAG: peptidoglycan editing factor PgeF [Pseudomonadota bacterium]